MTDQIQKIPLDQIKASFGNDRKTFDPDALQAFADGTRSSRHNIPAIIVRKQADGYQLIAGERRTRSACILFAEYETFSALCSWFGLDAGQNPYATIRAEVRDMTDSEALDTMLAENEQRVDLDPIEQGNGYKRRIADGQTLEHIASVTGRKISYITRRLAVVSLRPELQGMVAKGQLLLTYAEIIANRELTPYRQLMAITQFNACKFKTDEVLRELCAQLAEDQALDSQRGLFDNQLVDPGVQTIQHFEQKSPADPRKDSAPNEGKSYRQIVLNQSKFWKEQAELWSRYGKATESKLCLIAAKQAESIAALLPDHSRTYKKLEREGQTFTVYAP